ncbi:MAG: hypothetical protein EOM02_13740 [Synergistales bacterium]|nr:hypothetical protein [Synergistales bacterium]
MRVVVDDTGVGGGVTDRIRQVARDDNLSIEVVGSNNGAKPSDDNYLNWGAEAWGHFKRLLQGKLVSLPDDDDLRGELTGRKYSLDAKGRIRLEGKADMKKRGLSSPDSADAAVLACVNQVPTASLLGDVVDPKIHIVDPFPIEAHWPRWCALQGAPDGTYALLFLTCDPKGQMYVYDEMYISCSVPELATRYRRKIGTDPILEFISEPAMFRPDPIDGSRWADLFHRHSMPLAPGSGDIDAGVGALRQRLNVTQGNTKLKFFRGCERLLWELGKIGTEETRRTDRYMMFTCLWRLMLRNPAWRDMSSDQSFEPLDYPSSDV